MNKVFILSWDTPWAGAEVQGVYVTRELAEQKIVESALRGQSLSNVQLNEHEVVTDREKTLTEKVAAIPAVREAMAAGRKIQAIKAVREQILGTGLREAKDAVEAAEREGLLIGHSYVASDSVVSDSPRWVHVHDDREWDEIIDGEGDTWVHVGDGRYVVHNSGTDRMPSRSAFSPSTEEDIVSMYGDIRDRRDYR